MAEKLFQHIAKGKMVKGIYSKMLKETAKKFQGRDLFEGVVKEYSPLEEGGQPLERVDKEVVTTVAARLRWTAEAVCDYINYEVTRDVTNCIALTDLKFGDATFANMSATALLTIESLLLEIRAYHDRIPTLDLSRKWEDSGRDGIVKNGPSASYRTAKKTVPVIMHPATKEHPAQVKDVVEDKHVGTFETTYYSGASHPQRKADILSRIDELLIIVKKCRCRANEVEVQSMEIGAALFAFIYKE